MAEWLRNLVMVPGAQIQGISIQAVGPDVILASQNALICAVEFRNWCALITSAQWPIDFIHKFKPGIRSYSI